MSFHVHSRALHVACLSDSVCVCVLFDGQQQYSVKVGCVGEAIRCSGSGWRAAGSTTFGVAFCNGTLDGEVSGACNSGGPS